jgi:hypothetical protein
MFVAALSHKGSRLMKWRTKNSLIVVGLTATLLMVAGCSDDDGGADNNSNHVLFPDAGPQHDSSTPQPDASTGNCNTTGFNMATELATYKQGLLHYMAYNATGFPMDLLSVEIYASYNGPTTPGSYTLEGGPDSNFETCGLCPLIYTYSTAGDPAKVYYADTGTVEITSIGTIGGTFAATFHNLIFREVTIDSATFHSTVVPGGEVWCINNYYYSEPIQDDAGVCPYPGTCIGDNVADITVTSCETGNPVSLHTVAAGMNAMWLVGSHEW